MTSIISGDKERLVRLYDSHRPDATPYARKRWGKLVDRHLSGDHSNGRGLKILGVDGLETRNYFEFYVDEDDSLTISPMVAVLISGEWECFDVKEALGYTPFIRQDIDDRKAEVKRKSLQEKRDEN